MSELRPLKMRRGDLTRDKESLVCDNHVVFAGPVKKMFGQSDWAGKGGIAIGIA